MNGEFVPYKQALALKKLGFDEPCLLVYHRKKLVGVTNHEASGFMLPLISNKKLGSLTCTTPLKQQAFRWFREKYDLQHYIKKSYEFKKYFYTITRDGIIIDGTTAIDIGNTYEEAEHTCLDKLIEITKNK